MARAAFRPLSGFPTGANYTDLGAYDRVVGLQPQNHGVIPAICTSGRKTARPVDERDKERHRLGQRALVAMLRSR